MGIAVVMGYPDVTRGCAVVIRGCTVGIGAYEGTSGIRTGSGSGAGAGTGSGAGAAAGYASIDGAVGK